MAKPTTERRAHARFPSSVKIEGRSPDGDATAVMIASDLSLGGLYCTSTARFREMTRLSVRLILPAQESEPPLELDAVVVREQKLKSATGNNSKYELALFFMQMTNDQRERLARYLASS